MKENKSNIIIYMSILYILLFFITIFIFIECTYSHFKEGYMAIIGPIIIPPKGKYTVNKTNTYLVNAKYYYDIDNVDKADNF